MVECCFSDNYARGIKGIAEYVVPITGVVALVAGVVALFVLAARGSIVNVGGSSEACYSAAKWAGITCGSAAVLSLLTYIIANMDYSDRGGGRSRGAPSTMLRQPGPEVISSRPLGPGERGLPLGATSAIAYTADAYIR